MKTIIQKLNGILCSAPFYNQVGFNGFQKKIKPACITNIKHIRFFRQITKFCRLLALSPINFTKIKTFFQPVCKQLTGSSYCKTVRFPSPYTPHVPYVSFAIHKASKIVYFLYFQLGNLKFIFPKRPSWLCGSGATTRTILSITFLDSIANSKEMLIAAFTNSFNLGTRTAHNHNITGNN